MDQKHEGTPNPLNPSPKPETSSESIEPSVEDTAQPAPQPIQKTAQIASRPIKNVPRTMARPIRTMPQTMPKYSINSQPAQPQTYDAAQNIPAQSIEMDSRTANAQSVNPTPQVIGTTPQVSITEVKSSHKALKKKGLIVGGVIAIFIAVGCGVVAALLLLNKPEDPIDMAVKKFINGGYSQNIAIDGSIDIAIKDNRTAYSDVKIELDSQIVGGTAVNSTNATIKADLRNSDKSITVNLNEVYAKNGDLYLRVDGLTNAANTLDSVENQKTTIDCAGEEDCTTTISYIDTVKDYAEALKPIDNIWIKTSAEELSQIILGEETNEPLGCVTTFTDDVKNNMNSVSILYQQNPFITSSTEKIPIANKTNPVRRITFNKTNLENFTNLSKDLIPTKDFLNCIGQDSSAIDADGVVNAIEKLPPVYVEIDNQYQFTRLYSEYDNDSIGIKVDLDFSYPNNPIISEPKNHKTIDELKLQSTDTEKEKDVNQEVNKTTP